jgi:hypothetical protein
MILNNNVKSVYMNATGAATPNLDFLKQSLVDIDAKIVSAKNLINNYDVQRLAWKREAERLTNLQNGYNLQSKKAAIQTEINKAVDKMNGFQNLINTQNSLLATLNSDRLVIIDKISKYQAAVAQSLSQGNTDAGSQQVAELLIQQEVQKLKSEKYKYLKYGGIGLGIIVVTFVGIRMLK